MKKIFLTLALVCAYSTVNLPTEAARNAIARKIRGSRGINRIKQSLSDRIHHRKSDENTQILSNITVRLAKLGDDFDAARSAEFKFVRDQFMTTEEDCTLLIAFGHFAHNCQAFFYILERALAKLREEYGANLYAENSSTTNTKRQEQNEERAGRKKESIGKILDLLLSNGVKSSIANMKCSAIILLKIMQAYADTVPQADIGNLKRHADRISADYEQVSGVIKNDLVGVLIACKDVAEYEVEIDVLEALVDEIMIVCDMTALLKKYILARVPLRDTEIEELMNRCSLASKNKAPEEEDRSREVSYDRRDDDRDDRDRRESDRSYDRRDDDRDDRDRRESDRSYDRRDDDRNDRDRRESDRSYDRRDDDRNDRDRRESDRGRDNDESSDRNRDSDRSSDGESDNNRASDSDRREDESGRDSDKKEPDKGDENGGSDQSRTGENDRDEPRREA